MRRQLPLLLVALGVILVALLAPDAVLADAPMQFTTVRLDLPDSVGTEPRIAVGPDDRRWAITSEGGGQSTAVVFSSRDGGQTWQRTPATLPGQIAPTIDTDVVTFASGRVLGSELDFAGPSVPSAYTDDGGKTWQETRGSNRLADQDRQWFAVGPKRPDGSQPAYLLYHNLASGVAQHNMFVATSNDGGATFGPPVPIAQPGSDAYNDLQCSDSGGPSNITVNARTGRIYAFFTTRAGLQVGPADFGGCTATPAEFNIVNGTRVWVATSPDGSPGSWQDSLAVDDSKTGQVVSMQLAYGALDNNGGVYVAYPESKNPYPDLSGAAVKLTWQDPKADGTLDDRKWSKPVTLVPNSDFGGSNLVHLAAGDPGKVAVAYYRGARVPGADKPVWYTHVVHSLNVRDASPEIVDQQVSDVPAYKWTASEMMGVCSDPSNPAGGVQNGLACSRSTDVWGITEDAQCRISLVWPTMGPKTSDDDGGTKGVANAQNGTWVSTQTGGPSLCGSERSLPGGSFAAPYAPAVAPSGGAASSADRLAPVSRVARIRTAGGRIVLRGTARDRGCAKRLRLVRVAFARRVGAKGCRFIRGDGSFGPRTLCRHPRYLSARGTSRWTLRVSRRLSRGRYLAVVRAVDAVGNREKRSLRGNVVHLRVR